MDFEMDQTQALPMDDDDDFEEEESPPDKIVAQLKVLTCKGFPETIFDLKEGENVIGRHATNNIAIPLKSLSKQHACIEVHGESHLIHDMGSRNRTRRGKLFLKPNIRYEVKNCDVLTLADITCQYLIPETEDAGNMSDSSDSIDILQPTQAFPALLDNADKQTKPNTAAVVELKTPSHTSPRRVFAEDSDDNMPSSGGKTPGNESFIPDTQQPEGSTPANNTLVKDSDSDTDMEEDTANNNDKSVNDSDLDLSRLANASTLAVNESDLSNVSDKGNASTLAVNESDLANASTLAVNGADISVNGDEGQTLDPADMATQAYKANANEEEDGVESDNKFDACDAATLAYDIEETDDDDDGKRDVGDEATLAYQTDDQDKPDSALEATQAFAVPFPIDRGVAPSPIAKVNRMNGDDDEEDMDTDDSMADQPTQAFITPQMKPIMNSTQDDGLVDQSTMDDCMAATQAYGIDDSMAPTQPYKGGDVGMEPTQAYGVDDALAATQAYNATDIADQPTLAYNDVQVEEAEKIDDDVDDIDGDEPTQAYGLDQANEATQAYVSNGNDEDDDGMAPTQAYGDIAEQPTLACGGGYHGNDNGDDDEVEGDEPTQAYGLDPAIEATQAYASNGDVEDDDDDDGMAPTQAYGDIAEQPTLVCGGGEGNDDDDDMAPTQAYGVDDDDGMAPTQAYGDIAEQPTLACGVSESIDDDEDMAPTQAYGVDDDMAPTQAYGVDEDDGMAPTQAYGVSDGDMADQPTLAYGGADGPADDDDDDDMAPTQAYGDVAEASTVLHGDAEESGGGGGDNNKDTDKPDVEDEDEPTQAYGLDEENVPIDDTEEPTQAYGIDTEIAPEDSDEPTQAYGDVEADDDTEDMSSKSDDAVTKEEGNTKRTDSNDTVAKDSNENGNTELMAAVGKDDEDEGETQIPDSEGEDDVAPGGRRLVSILAQIPTKSVLTSPSRDSKNKKAQRVSFQTPDTDEDSEETPPPTKRSTRGRKSQPKTADKDVEGEKDEATDDVDIAPTRMRSLLRHKKKTKDTEDGGSPTKDTSKKQPADDKKPSTKKGGKMKKSMAAGSRKIVEFFQPAAIDDEAEEAVSSNGKDKETKSDGKKSGRKSARSKANDCDDEKAQGLPSTSDSLTEVDAKPDSTKTRRSAKGASKGLTEVDGKPDPKTTRRSVRGASKVEGDGEVDGKPDAKNTRRSVRGASKVEDNVESGVRTSGRKGAKGVEQSQKATATKRQRGRTNNSKEASLENKEADDIDTSPLPKTVEIRIPKLDADSCETEEPKKASTRKGGRRSVAASSSKDDDHEVTPKKSSGRGKLNDVPNKDNFETTDDSATTRATRGKKGVKNDEKMEKSEDDSNTKGAKGRPTRGRQRGGKDEENDKKEKSEDETLSFPARTSQRNKSGEQTKPENKKAASQNEAQESTTKASTRSGRGKASDKTEKELMTKASTRSGRTNASEKTLDTDTGTSKRGRRSTAPAENTETQSTGRRSRKNSPAESENQKPAAKFKKPVAVVKGARNKVAAVKQDEDEDEEMAPRRNTRRGASPDTVQPTSAPSTPTSKRGKRNQSPSPTPSTSTSPYPSPSPTKRARKSEVTSSEVHSPTLRRRVSESKPKVMFTGVTDKDWEKVCKIKHREGKRVRCKICNPADNVTASRNSDRLTKKRQEIVTTLGGELVDSVYECTHLVTDKVRRTVKFLCCLAKGAIIVNPKWLDTCKVNKAFVDPTPYLLKDRAAEKQHKFNMVTSYQKASKELVLKGLKVHVTSGVKPEPQQMKDIIKCAGGEFASKPSNNSIIVTCEADLSSIKPKDATIVSAEFILSGILRQDVDPSKYQLDVATAPSTTNKKQASSQPTRGGKRKR